MFVTALSVTVKTWKQPRHNLIGKWINCGIPKQSNKKENYQAIKGCGGKLNVYY